MFIRNGLQEVLLPFAELIRKTTRRIPHLRDGIRQFHILQLQNVIHIVGQTGHLCLPTECEVLFDSV